MLGNNQPCADKKRRQLILAALGGCALSLNSAIAEQLAYPELGVSLYNVHTGESYKREFWANGEYDIDALEEANYFLRDHRTNDVTQIDPRLLSMLFLMSKKVGGKQPFSVISGYRTAETNRKLARLSSYVDKNSFHIKGRAVDVRIPGIQTTRLQSAAINMRTGGVGYYEKSNFIHMDTGPHRVWSRA